MGKVIHLNETKSILDYWQEMHEKGEIDQLMIIGITKDDNLALSASKDLKLPEVLWILESLKMFLILEGGEI